MFTGIVTETGRIAAVTPLEGGLSIAIDAPATAPHLGLGDSVAVAGVCQTVVRLEPARLHVEAIGTTLSRTTFPELTPGRRVNLERPLALGQPLGGHLVQGHVDGVGIVTDIADRGEHILLDVRMPDEVAEATVLHGSITIDGVSLTVNALPAPDVLQVALIPYTWQHTTFPDLRVGQRVNLESDMLGKFVVHHLRRREMRDSRGTAPPSSS